MTQQTSGPISTHQHVRGRLLALAQHLAFLLPWLLIVGLSVLNLRHVSQLGVSDDAYINSGGIAVLIQLLALTKQNNQLIGIFGVSDHFKKILRMVGITKFAEIHDSLESALAKMA